ncbi:MAG: hypothetical protein HRT45_16985 [Bdellovibrionales bacterium]|nr:hypothetical protein [Bdellovibrionales bacterium]
MKRLLIMSLVSVAVILPSLQAGAKSKKDPQPKAAKINFITCSNLSPYFLNNLQGHLFRGRKLNPNLDGMLNSCVRQKRNAIGRGLNLDFIKKTAGLVQPLKQRTIVGSYTPESSLFVSRITLPGGDKLIIKMRALSAENTEGTLVRLRGGKVINRAYILGNTEMQY